MGPQALLVIAGLVFAEAGTPAATAPPADAGSSDAAEWSAGVSPIDLVPRLELRQSYLRSEGGASFHDTTAELDIQFLNRLLLRYQLAGRVFANPDGQSTGIGDVEVDLFGIVASTSKVLIALIAGAVLDTATQPQLGAGKQQLILGGGAAIKPRPWFLAYGIAQEQFAVAGNSARPDVNRLDARVGAIVFGRLYNWLKVDLDPTVDFPRGPTARLFGTLEVGSLIAGRVGLFLRTQTQLVGKGELEYSLTAGIRYLFRLEKGKPK
jgi:hypothetical protein